MNSKTIHQRDPLADIGDEYDAIDRHHANLGEMLCNLNGEGDYVPTEADAPRAKALEGALDKLVAAKRIIAAIANDELHLLEPDDVPGLNVPKPDDAAS